MRVLLLSLHFAPDTVSNAVVATELAEELAARGHRVTAVAALPYHQAHRIEAGFRGRLWQASRHGSVRVYRTWLWLHGKKHDVGRRMLSYASFNLSSTLVAALTGPHDLVITPSPPLTIGICGWLLARLWNAPFVYNVQDIYPEAGVRLGLFRTPRVVRFFAWLERFVYARADAVTVVSEDFRANLLAKGVSEAKLAVIPNGVDVSFIRPAGRDNPFARAHGLTDRFVVLYAGNIGLAQGIETVVAAAGMSQDAHVRFVVVGAGARAEVVRRAAPTLTNLSYLPFQPRSSVPDVYAAADAGLVLLRPGMSATSMPSKVYSIMAAARPVIASVDQGSEVWRLIERAGCGICVPAGNAAALLKAIERLRDEPSFARQLGERGRAYVEQYQSREVVGERYDTLLAALRAAFDRRQRRSRRLPASIR